MIALSFSGNVITVNGNNIKLDYPIQTAFLLGDKIIVLYDPDSYVPKFGQFQNLLAIDLNGKEIWKAELPTTMTGDCYYKIASKNPLKAYSFKSYECEIDLDTGRIKNKTFLK
jgi:hypothetical protein